MADERNNAKGFILGFIGGAVAGAVLALLYAPKSGRELRADIREKTDNFLDEAEERVRAARTKASAIVSEASTMCPFLSPSRPVSFSAHPVAMSTPQDKVAHIMT